MKGFCISDAIALSHRMAADSMVLMKNDRGCLPLAKGTKLNLFGYNATDAGFLISGGGSGTGAWVINAATKRAETVSLAQAFREAGVEINEQLLDQYAAWDTLDLDSNIGFKYDPAANTNNGGPCCTLTNPTADFYTDELMQQARAFSDVAVVVIGRYGRENGAMRVDRNTVFREIPLVQFKGKELPKDFDRTYLQLSTEEELMLQQVKASFDKVIVLLNTCNTMEAGFLDDEGIRGALFVGIPGQDGASVIPQLLFGDVNPSGKTADVYAYHHKADPTYANGTVEYKATIPFVAYQEGIYYGYRWYETAFADGIKLSVNGYDLDFSSEEGYRKIVQYPFGYGLSYTTFSWELVEKPNATLADVKTIHTVKVKVTNTGSVAGKDVVQLYVTPPYTPGGIEKAAVTLVDFAKTDLLQPGESQELTLSFTGYDLASYDCYDANGNGFAGYELEKGEYRLKLMKNAHVPAEIDAIVMQVQKGIQIENDPVTGVAVVNRFTGEDSFGSPLDGGVTYMTRADFAGTFPSIRTEGASTKTQEITYDGELKTIAYGQDSGLRLFTKPDGFDATLEELRAGSAGLVRNEELFKKLFNYDDDEAWDRFLTQITKEETLDIIRKGGFQMHPTASLGLPYSMECDGPSGLARNKWISYPGASLYGCSWNRALAYEMGAMVAKQSKTANISHWYAPGLNLHRSPYTSRNYEYYSEDPILSGKMATAVIKGAKQGGLAVYVKHFAASEAGRNPVNVNTWLTEQAFREIYLKAFEFTVKDADANGMMTAFNRIGDILCSWNSAMIRGVLRGEWKFHGCVITDWWLEEITASTGVLAGNDKMLAPDGKPCTQPIELDDDRGMEANAARLSVKNILYPLINAYVTQCHAESDCAQ